MQHRLLLAGRSGAVNAVSAWLEPDGRLHGRRHRRGLVCDLPVKGFSSEPQNTSPKRKRGPRWRFGLVRWCTHFSGGFQTTSVAVARPILANPVDAKHFLILQ